MLNYGHISNARSLMLYGFCLSDNPFASVEVFASVEQLSAAKRELLVSFGIELPFVIRKDKIFPMELLVYLRLFLSDNDFDDKLHIANSQIVSQDIEKCACKVILDVLGDMLGGYNVGLSLEEDAQESEGSVVEEDQPASFLPPCCRRGHARILVLSEKLLLRAAIAAVQSYIDRDFSH
jgi:Rubisco LSMT substrate-binding